MIFVKRLISGTMHDVKCHREGGRESPDPLHGSVGMSAVCATMEEATLSPRAHMALLDGPERR